MEQDKQEEYYNHDAHRKKSACKDKVDHYGGDVIMKKKKTQKPTQKQDK